MFCKRFSKKVQPAAVAAQDTPLVRGSRTSKSARVTIDERPSNFAPSELSPSEMRTSDIRHSDMRENKVSPVDENVQQAIDEVFDISRVIDREGEPDAPVEGDPVTAGPDFSDILYEARARAAARSVDNQTLWDGLGELSQAAVESEEKQERLSSGVFEAPLETESVMSEAYYRGHCYLVGKWLHFIDYMTLPSASNRECHQLFRSLEAVRLEQRRQKEHFRWIIHPFSHFKMYWDAAVMLAIIITLVTLPLEVAFYSDPEAHPNFYHQMFYILNLLSEVVFIADMPIHFRTGVIEEDTDEVMLKSSHIAKHYLKSWFVIDFVSALPIDLMYLAYLKAHHKEVDPLYYKLRLIRMGKIFALLRLFKIFRLLANVNRLEKIMLVNEKAMAMINLILLICVYLHWNACIQYMISYSLFYPEFPQMSWLTQLNVIDATVTRKYSVSLLRAVSQTLAVNYGYAAPFETVEIWVVTVSCLTGCTFYAIFIGFLARLIGSMDTSRQKYDEMLGEVREFLRFNKVPLETQGRVVRFFDHKYRRKFFDEEKIIHHMNLSMPIREAIMMHTGRRIIENIWFLKNASTDLKFNIVSHLSFQVYFPGDYIIRANRKLDSMYFIAHGRVLICSASGHLIDVLTDGMYFGEEWLLLGERLYANVIADDMCDVYQLRKTSFDQVLDEYPEIKDTLTQIAIKQKELHTHRLKKHEQRDKHTTENKANQEDDEKSNQGTPLIPK